MKGEHATWTGSDSSDSRAESPSVTPEELEAWGERIARREAKRAVSELGGPGAPTERQRDAIEALARDLAARVLSPPVEGIHAAREAGHVSPESIDRLFDVDGDGRPRR